MRSLGRRRREDNIKVDLKEISYEDVKWIELYMVTKQKKKKAHKCVNNLIF
jgi:hypothetical protein